MNPRDRRAAEGRRRIYAIRQTVQREVLLVTLLLFSVRAEAAVAPVTASPGDLARVALIGDACPAFSWGVVPEAKSYELVVYRVGEESEEAKPVLRQSFAGSVSNWTPSLDRCLDRGGRYAWTVRAVVGRAATQWSQPSLFQVALGPSEGEFREAVAVVQRYLAAQSGEDTGAVGPDEARTDSGSGPQGSGPAAGAAAVGANQLSVDGGVAATFFSGDGSTLTNLDPASLMAGTANIDISGTAADADTVDGLHAAALAPAVHGHDVSQVSNAATLGTNVFTGDQTIPNLQVPGELQLGGDVPFSSAQRAVFSAVMPGPVGVRTYATFIPERDIVVTRLTAEYATSTGCMPVGDDPRVRVTDGTAGIDALLPVPGSFDSGPFSLVVAAGSPLEIQGRGPGNCLPPVSFLPPNPGGAVDTNLTLHYRMKSLGDANSCPSQFADSCGGLCTDLSRDELHCGDCATECPSGTDVFSRCCGGSCIDYYSDANNCGECGKECGPGAFCLLGGCIVSCDLVQQDCPLPDSCYITAANEGYCAAPGAGTQGDECSSSPDCGLGHDCLLSDAGSSTFFRCAFYCDPAGLGQTCSDGPGATFACEPLGGLFPGLPNDVGICTPS